MNKPDKMIADSASPERISAEELDRRFDDGEDVSAYFDWASARRPGSRRSGSMSISRCGW